MRKRVAIVGVGQTSYAEDQRLEEVIFEAATNAPLGCCPHHKEQRSENKMSGEHGSNSALQHLKIVSFFTRHNLKEHKE